MSNFQCLFWDAVSLNSRGLKQHKKMTQKEGSSCSLNIDINVPRAVRLYVQDICNTCSLLTASQWFTVLHRPAVCARKKKRNFIWQVDHCALYGRKQSVFCLGRFLLLHQTPFSCLQPWGGKDGWISDTCEMLNWSHQLGLSQQLKVTDPKTLCAVVSFFEMPYGTKILFFPHWFMRVWRLSQCRAVLKDSSLVWLKTWNTLKYLFCKVVQVNSTVSQLCSAI